MATVHLNGVDIYYRTTGTGERVVLTHGSWTNAETWQALTSLLENRYEVVVWDRRGHSRSQTAPGPGSWKEDASDLAALIQHLGNDPVHVVGNSSGGAVVLNLVAARPDLVKSAAVHEPPALALLDGSADEALAAERAGNERVREFIEAGEHGEAARFFVDELVLGPGTWDAFPAELRNTLEANAATYLDEMDEPFEIDSIDWRGLAGAGTPLLATLGSRSSGVERAVTEELARRVPGELRAVVGAGHLPHRTHSDEYAAVLVDFFGRSMSVV